MTHDGWPIVLSNRMGPIKLTAELRDPQHVMQLFTEHMRCERDFLVSEIGLLEIIILKDDSFARYHIELLQRLRMRMEFVKHQLRNINTAIDHVKTG